MRTRARVDDNQKEIVHSLRQIPGVSVFVLSTVGKGFSDLIVGYRKRNYLFEIKDGNKTASRRTLTEAQKKFHEQWTGEIYVCKNLNEILNILLKT